MLGDKSCDRELMSCELHTGRTSVCHFSTLLLSFFGVHVCADHILISPLVLLWSTIWSIEEPLALCILACSKGTNLNRRITQVQSLKPSFLVWRWQQAYLHKSSFKLNYMTVFLKTKKHTTKWKHDLLFACFIIVVHAYWNFVFFPSCAYKSDCV